MIAVEATVYLAYPPDWRYSMHTVGEQKIQRCHTCSGYRSKSEAMRSMKVTARTLNWRITKVEVTEGEQR